MRRARAGFTLIELLIVVVIIGILAAVALPQLGKARERGFYAALKSDLKSVQIAQEMYYYKHFRYTDDLEELGFTPSARVTVSDITLGGAGGNQGWYASATHETIGPDEGCVIYDGDIDGPIEEVNASAEKAGVPACAES